jgi:cysteine desulfurase / selenocysteine lyase
MSNTMPGNPGFPDLQFIAAMANELFQALPTSAIPTVSGVQSNPSSALPTGQHQPQLARTATTPAPVSTSADQRAAAGSAPNYYFAENASNYLSNNVQIEQFAAPLSPPAAGYPDEAALQALLADDRFVTNNQDLMQSATALNVPNALENYSDDHQQRQIAGGERVSSPAFQYPTEQDIQQLLATELRITNLAAPAPAVSSTPDSRFYFLDSAAQPVFGNTPRHGQFAAESQGFDVHAIRSDFPILAERVNGRPLVWFDNAATTQKPRSVIERVSYFYEHENSNIHRAAHELAARATDAYESARDKVAKFLGAKSAEEIVFVRGATEGINLLASTFGQQRVGEGDEIIISQLEHHANIVPWYMLAQRVGAILRVIPVDDTGQILLEEFSKLINSRTKLVAISHVSNALGTVTPVKDIIEIAHANGVPVIVDGAQSVSHMRVNMQALDADFFVFSGHKLFGPTGIGAVYGKAEHWQTMPPWQGGGNMIADVTFDRIVYQEPPNRFEAGTGNIADAVGLGAAIDYVERIGMDRIARYEHDLLAYATRLLQPIPGVRLIGTAVNKASVLSFVLANFTTEEVSSELNRAGIAVRAGHHCAQPILRRFGLETTVRPSLAFYNTCEEIDLFISVIERLAHSR